LYFLHIYSCQAQPNQTISLQDEVKNYTLKPLLTVFYSLRNGLAGRLQSSRKAEFIPHQNGAKVKKCSQVYNRGQGGLLDIVLHPDYAKMAGLHHLCATEGEGEGGYKLIRAKLENESLTQIESLYNGPNTAGLWFQNRFDNDGYLYSRLENAGQSLSIHKTSPETTEKFTASMDGSIPADPFRGNWVPEAIYYYRNPQD
jgi:glucose/arabinose dehydrogenase